jgi:hypothetical protein
MLMPPGVRKLALTTHVTVSVGWLGAVLVFLVLAVAGLTSADAQTVRAVYLSMEAITWYALLPLAIASLLTGIVQSLGTRWGLLRHYWVVFKLVLNVVATAVLLLYTQTVGDMADMAQNTTTPLDDLHALGWSPLLHATAALLVLLVATVLAVYKPPGFTPYGLRRLAPCTPDGSSPTIANTGR